MICCCLFLSSALKKWIASNHSLKKSKTRAKGSATKPGISATFTNAQPPPPKLPVPTLQTATNTTTQRSNTATAASGPQHSVAHSRMASPPVLIASNPGVIGSSLPAPSAQALQHTPMSGLRVVESHPQLHQGLQYNLFYPSYHTPPHDSPRVIRSNTTPIPYPSPHHHHHHHHPHSYHSSPASQPHQSPLPIIHSPVSSTNGNHVHQSHPLTSTSYGTALTFSELLEAAHASPSNVAGVWSDYPQHRQVRPVESPVVVPQLSSSQSWLKFALNKERIIQCMKTVRK